MFCLALRTSDGVTSTPLTTFEVLAVNLQLSAALAWNQERHEHFIHIFSFLALAALAYQLNQMLLLYRADFIR
jgi:hypothetical protein